MNENDTRQDLIKRTFQESNSTEIIYCAILTFTWNPDFKCVDHCCVILRLLASKKILSDTPRRTIDPAVIGKIIGVLKSFYNQWKIIIVRYLRLICWLIFVLNLIVIHVYLKQLSWFCVCLQLRDKPILPSLVDIYLHSVVEC